MTPTLAVFTFINAWWICLFMSLPFGRQQEGAKDDVAYNAAPAKFNWKKASLIATVLASIVTLVLALIINSGYFHMDTLS